MTFGTKAPIEPVLDMVSTYGPWSPIFFSGNYPGAATNYEAANRTIYIPILVPLTRGRVTAKRVWWANGNSVNAASTIGVGIYTDISGRPSIRLTSASAAQAGTNTIQFADCTDVNLSPGRYWLAITSTATATTTIMTAGNLAFTRTIRFEEATNMPATATPVNGSSNSALWLYGFSTQTAP
jgi:hypothetical protein